MLLKVFKANRIFSLFLIPLTGIALLWYPFINGTGNSIENPMPLYQLFNGIGAYPFWQTILLLAVSLIISFIISDLSSKHAFVYNRSFLPSAIYLALSLSIPEIQKFQPVTLSSLFVMLALRRLFATYNKSSILANCFDAAFLLGIASLFYFHSIFLLLLVPIAILIIHGTFSFRKILITIIGALVPWILTVSVYKFTGGFANFLEIIGENIHIKPEKTVLGLPSLIYLSYIGLLILLSSIFVLNQYDVKKIHSRRYLAVLLLLFIGCGVLFLFQTVSYEIFIIMAIPLTYLLTNYFTFSKRQFWSDLLFTILLISALSLPFVSRYV